MENDSGPPLRKARIIGVGFLGWAIVLPFIIMIIPESEFPEATGPFLLSWVMLFLMPIEILLVYLVYRFFSKKAELEDLVGPAILMYTLAIAPSIYAFIIGFIDLALRYIAAPLGLAFSLSGFLLASMLLPRLEESIQTSSHTDSN
ncbi:MAG: hypothetical protein JSW61_02745 [Candidatus Thorarchaeota archaeon]|nr:MAG: hypothetical protein JSW61_02745 [Candidatus Thorarchaeota archaeon]